MCICPVGAKLSKFLTIRTWSLGLLEVPLQQHLKDSQTFHLWYKMEMWLVFFKKLLHGSSSHLYYYLFNICLLAPTGKSLTLELSSHPKTDASDKQLWSSSQTVIIRNFPPPYFLFEEHRIYLSNIYWLLFNRSKPDYRCRK